MFPLVTSGGLYIVEDIDYPADFFCERFDATGFAAVIAAVTNSSFLKSKNIQNAREAWVERADRKRKGQYRELESSIKGARHRLSQAETEKEVKKLEEAIHRREKEISLISPDGIGKSEKRQILTSFNERMQVIEKLTATVECVHVRDKNIVFRRK